MRSAAHLELVRESVTTAANLAHERTLPVIQDLAAMVPSGALQRGSTLSVHGVGATSFALALAGQAVREGSFMAVIASPSFGLAACLDFDIPLRRIVQFVLPSNTENWAQAVAAVVEGFDVVMLADEHRASNSQARQLLARNRERGSILIRVGGPAWPDAADLRFDVGSPEWSGLGQGHGHLLARKVAVQVAGRRYHGPKRVHEIMLPAHQGGVAPATPAPATPLAPAPVIPAVVVLEPAMSLTSVTDAPVIAAPAAPAEAGRFAGADIDAMLDVVDQDHAGEGADHGHAAGFDAAGFDAAGFDAAGFDAIA
ncbi:MAG: hypothetical protein ACI9TF_000842 [Paracrocinitomix sp.]|jgi:hypothetical protein